MRARSWLLIAILWTGCGRIGFGEPEINTNVDASSIDETELDAALGPSEELIFGETANADVLGVTFDTSLNIGRPDSNCGSCSQLFGGNGEAGLVRFAIETIPIGSRVEEAQIEFWLSSLHTLGGQVAFYVIREAWDQGDGNQTTGFANWMDRQPGVSWTSAGVGPGSRDRDPIATLEPASLDEPVVVTVPVQTAQQWLDQPGQNHGILLKGSDYPGSGGDHPHFASSKNGAQNRRPLLRLRFRRPL